MASNTTENLSTPNGATSKFGGNVLDAGTSLEQMTHAADKQVREMARLNFAKTKKRHRKLHAYPVKVQCWIFIQSVLRCSQRPMILVAR